MKRNKILLFFIFILMSISPLFFNNVKIYAFGESSNTLTTVFTSKEYQDLNSGWVVDKVAFGFASDKGVQDNKSNTGSGATSKDSYSGISKIEITYFTSQSATGSITTYINSSVVSTYNVDETNNGLGEHIISINTNNTGKVKFVVNTTNKSIYIYSISITASSINIEQDTDNTPPPSVSGEYCSYYTGNYYNGVGTLKGEQLINKLHDIIYLDSAPISYDGLWSAYASSDVDSNNKIIDMYSNIKYNVGDHSGSYKKIGDMYNREHTIPQSWFNEHSPMKSDLFHVYPTDGKTNGLRSDNPHGNVVQGTPYYSDAGGVSRVKIGNCSSQYYSGTVAEVDDEYKGDFARTYFYFACRYYEKIVGFKTASKVVFKDTFPYLTDFALDTYLQWAKDDPVSQKEIDRNNAVYLLQGNRNPFIDHQSWVFDIWDQEFKYEDTGVDPIDIDEDDTEIIDNFIQLDSKSKLSGTYSITNNIKFDILDVNITYTLDVSSLSSVNKDNVYVLILEGNIDEEDISSCINDESLHLPNYDETNQKFTYINNVKNSLTQVYTVCFVYKSNNSYYNTHLTTYSAKTLANKLNDTYSYYGNKKTFLNKLGGSN